MSTLWDSCAAGNAPATGRFLARSHTVALNELAHASILGGKLEALRARSVLLATRQQLSSAVALLELDGVARRLVLCTPDLTPEQLAGVAKTADADAVLIDAGDEPALSSLETFRADLEPQTCPVERRSSHATEWVLLTSGTTGQPKLVLHSVESLAGALPRQPAAAKPMVWSTFYDIRRYGGLQIYLRAVLTGSPLVLSSAGERVHDFLSRAGAAGVTHISGTPSHWRNALMSGDTGLIDPEYVRLSGEVADQTVLDGLKAAYPKARIAHAFASTEAGVAFDVNDGLAGFPSELIDTPSGAIEMKVQDGTLWIRSPRTASRYLGEVPLAGGAGFIDTGDLLELQGSRYYFRGRKGGVINVGGLKVFPEEVEAVLNADPRVRMSRVSGRRSPITGALVVAEVVLDGEQPPTEAALADIKTDLLEACRRDLAKHKVPAQLKFVAALQMSAAGKLVRHNA